jgi:hypothetical protein
VNMSKCTARNLQFLQSLSKAHHVKRKRIISTCNEDNINALAEIAWNTLRGNLSFNPSQLSKLRKHKETVRKLARKTLSPSQKRNILHQKGGFLPLLVTAFLSALGSVAGRAISNSF